MPNQPKPIVRPIALGIIRRADGRVLMERGTDEVRNETYWRIIGGGIEFQEQAVDALVREVDEELGLAIEDVRFLGVIENIFFLNGAPGHEIMMVHEARFQDPRAYQRDIFKVNEAAYDDGEAHWIDYREAQQRGEKVHPQALVEFGWLDAAQRSSF